MAVGRSFARGRGSRTTARGQEEGLEKPSGVRRNWDEPNFFGERKVVQPQRDVQASLAERGEGRREAIVPPEPSVAAHGSWALDPHAQGTTFSKTARFAQSAHCKLAKRHVPSLGTIVSLYVFYRAGGSNCQEKIDVLGRFVEKMVSVKLYYARSASSRRRPSAVFGRWAPSLSMICYTP